MATDHRGRSVHAGKRTHQENKGYHPDYKWDSGGYFETKLEGARLLSPRNPLPELAYKFVNTPMIRETGQYSKAWNTTAADRMVRTASMDPDTAHISLSNDEYL